MYKTNKYNAKRVAILVAIFAAILAAVAYITISVCTWAWDVSMDYLYRLFNEATAKEYQIWAVVSVTFLSICAYSMRGLFITDIHNENCNPGRHVNDTFVRKDKTSAPTNRNSGKKVNESVATRKVHDNAKVVNKKNVPFDFNEHDPWIYA